MTDRVADARLAEIETEYADLLKSVDDDGSTLIDGPGAASAFYGSLSLSEVVSLCGELIKHRRSQDAGGWRLITDNPPLDREFLGCRVRRTNPRTGQLVPDSYFHIRSLHVDYAGGPQNWTWNSADGMYGIVLTHWRELPPLPASPSMEPTNAQ